ncbi:MAG: hypothetical protein NZ853_05625 [Leptospiraceae bacterium]|nr:hypothetical protein [Leptospiraceae bacterium]MDW7976572.1 hypothetical protein [Leptospiraceae bacterium]
MIEIFKKIDELISKIPYRVRKLILFISIGLWVILALIVSVYAFLEGRKVAPAIGEDPFKAELQETIQKNQNQAKTYRIILPDLKDLVKEEAPLQIESINNQRPTSITEKIDRIPQEKIELLKEQDELIFPNNQDPLTQRGNFSLEEFRNLPEKKEVPPQPNKKLELIEIEN